MEGASGGETQLSRACILILLVAKLTVLSGPVA